MHSIRSNPRRNEVGSRSLCGDVATMGIYGTVP